MPRNQNTTKVRGFAGLVNTVSPEELTGANRAQFPLLEGENVYLTNARRLKSRPGYVLQTAGSHHSLWSSGDMALVVRDQSLIALDRSLNETVLRSDLTRRSPMQFVQGAGGTVYYINEAGERGSYSVATGHQPWGLQPLLPAALIQTAGSLPTGVYRIATTQRLASGEESGVEDYAMITLSSRAGIDVAIPPVDPNAATVSVYCSLADSETLYEVAQVSTGTASVVIRNTVDFGRPLQTLDVVAPFPGTQVGYHKGRMLIADGPYLFYTDPFSPSWFRMNQFFAFADDISLVAPVDNGIYVSADRTYFLQGNDPETMNQDVVSDAKAVKGTLQYLLPGEMPEINQEHAVWLSDRGFILGAPGGVVQHMTEADFTFAVSELGTLGKVKQDGVTTLVGLMKSPTDEDNNFGMTDRVSVEIVRNSVV